MLKTLGETCPEDIRSPAPRTFAGLRDAENACRRCPLYRDATQAVPGEGPISAALMMVGEQPGNDEDFAGRPFVGPAGRLLDRALTEAGLKRGEILITNAVKHFKFEQRGKRRLHKRPNAHEIDRCRWWLDLERKIAKPKVILALGATAARSLTGKAAAIGAIRGKVLSLGEVRLVVTMHPSALLRSKDEADRKQKYAAFVADLKLCAKQLKAG